MTDPSTAPTLEEAWHRFGDGLRRWIARRLPKGADADDILQQVFLAMAASPPGEVPMERLGAWLYRVARNTLVDQTRRERVRATKPLEPETTPHPDEEPVRRSLTRCLAPMLATLPPNFAEALRRVEFEGRSQKAVAAELGLSYSAMKSRVQRGRRLLRSNVEACCRPDEDLNCGGCEPEAPCHGAHDGEQRSRRRRRTRSRRAVDYRAHGKERIDMKWTELLKSEAEYAYHAAEGLMDLVDADKLAWKPEVGEWMTTSELLRHMTNACGWCCERFVTDTWLDVMQGTAPSPGTDVESIAEAKQLLAEDKALTLRLIEEAGEETLAEKQMAAPWDPTLRPLGQHILGMIAHLGQHKGQLFYYLKLQGKPVTTWTLYGIPEPPSA